MPEQSNKPRDKHRHHFVPQFYLRFFGSEKRVDLYYIPSRRFLGKVSIKHQCQREHFYGKDQLIEDALGEFEGHAATVLRKILNENSTQLSRDDRQILLQFILFQHQRTPVAVALRQANSEVMKHAIVRATDGDFRVEEYVNRPPKKVPDPVRENLQLAVGGFKYLEDLKIKLLVNETSIGFMTSDSPVVLFNQAAYGIKGLGVTGWVQPGLQVFFPLSPRACILLYDGRMYSVKSSKRGAVSVVNENDIIQVNALQALSAQSGLYFCANEATLASVQELPFAERKSPQERIGYHIAKSQEDPNRGLVGLYIRQLEFKLDLSIVKMHADLSKGNVFMHFHRPRPLVAHHYGPKDSPSKRKGKSKSVRYEIIRDQESPQLAPG